MLVAPDLHVPPLVGDLVRDDDVEEGVLRRRHVGEHERRKLRAGADRGVHHVEFGVRVGTVELREVGEALRREVEDALGAGFGVGAVVDVDRGTLDLARPGREVPADRQGEVPDGVGLVVHRSQVATRSSVLLGARGGHGEVLGEGEFHAVVGGFGEVRLAE